MSSVLVSVSGLGGASSSDVDQLEHIVRQASCIFGGVLSSMASLYSTEGLRSRARKIVGDPMHPANCLFEPSLPADVLELSKLELVGLDTAFSLKPFFLNVL